MPRENMISFIKKSLIGALCAGVISAGGYMIAMLLGHDKMLALLDYKVTIIMNHVAPEATDTPVVSKNH